MGCSWIWRLILGIRGGVLGEERMGGGEEGHGVDGGLLVERGVGGVECGGGRVYWGPPNMDART